LVSPVSAAVKGGAVANILPAVGVSELLYVTVWDNRVDRYYVTKPPLLISLIMVDYLISWL